MAGSKKRKQQTFEDEQKALAEVANDPRSEEARVRLCAALRSQRSLIVASAARLIKQRCLAGFDGELKAAFERFLDDPVKTDPSCNAKLAAIEALDYAESMDAEPFLRAARHVQKEPAWGAPVDTAAGLRARGVVALARINY